MNNMEIKPTKAEIKEELNHQINNALFTLGAQLSYLKEGEIMKILKDNKGNIISHHMEKYTIEEAHEFIQGALTRIREAVNYLNKNL